ncbi:hypothetical protein Pcinc_014650 [Petrolisthes cinctipes]|uniref:MADF domain-containing protein n=1 Tax=Petrolisthes cinctipes TaxID=88211 RepID=A0AAE1FUZ1_PETCI|nr:hypothetical protein Pcinc_014650 [Petrolisthes cinctipes]
MSQVRCRFESHHTRSVIPKRPKIKSKEYSDREAKAAAYSVLIEKLKQKDTSANRETVTKKINAMRSSFRKEVKKVTASRRSGAAADDIYQPRLWYYNLLLFLQDQEVGRDSVTNVNEVRPGPADTHMATLDGGTAGLLEEPSHESQASSVEPHIPLPTGSRKRARPDPSDALLSVITERIQSTRHEDEWDLLGRTVACKLRRMHDDQRVIAERLVNEVMYHGLLKNLSANSTIGIRTQLTHTVTVADVHN